MGCPWKLSACVERLVLWQTKVLRQQEGNFTIKRVMERSGKDWKMWSGLSDSSAYVGITRLSQRQCSAKGHLIYEGLQKPFPLCKEHEKEVQRRFLDRLSGIFWDGVSLIHKFNPADWACAPNQKIWRKCNEGLARSCTAKGLHCGTGRRVAKFFVAISYRKGVILCEQYDVLNGPYFKDLVERELPRMFRVADKRGSKIFIQDGDPSQNSVPAHAAWKRVGARLISILAQSPDRNTTVTEVILLAVSFFPSLSSSELSSDSLSSASCRSPLSMQILCNTSCNYSLLQSWRFLFHCLQSNSPSWFKHAKSSFDYASQCAELKIEFPLLGSQTASIRKGFHQPGC